MFGRATFVMDRGYDDNKMFLKLDELKQDYVIRLTLLWSSVFVTLVAKKDPGIYALTRAS